METGTLKELNVKPGDVVMLGGWSKKIPMTVGPDMVARSADNSYAMTVEQSTDPDWFIISRAQPTPDLTTITTPFGLLDEATQEALRSHGGPYEWWDGRAWQEIREIGHEAFVVRVKPGPIIETETMKITNADGMPMAYATVNMRNGKPDWSTLQVRND